MFTHSPTQKVRLLLLPLKTDLKDPRVHKVPLGLPDPLDLLAPRARLALSALLVLKAKVAPLVQLVLPAQLAQMLVLELRPLL